MPGPANSLNISEAGFQSFDGVSVFRGRTLTAGAGITIANGTGVAGNPVISATGASVDLHAARFIVSPGSTSDGANYTSIASAYAAAVGTGAPQTIFLQPGIYTEDITLSAGINLAAFDCDALTPNVTILGKLTVAFAGTVSISGIKLKTNSDFCLAVTGSSATIVNIKNCVINANNNVAISYTSNSGSSKIYIQDCRGNIDTTGISYFTYSGAGSLQFDGGVYENNGASTTAATISGSGSVGIRNCYFNCSITTSSTSNITIDIAEYHGALIHNSTGTSSVIYNSLCESGSSSAISVGAGGTINLSNVEIQSQNTNAITGAGTVKFAGVVFVDTSSLINTTTQTPLIRSNDAVKITTPGAYPYTTVSQDGVILVDTSAARTINLVASPATGQMHRIKDNVGSAAANNITITPAAGTIDGVASIVLSSNWASIDVCYNGTSWRVL